MKKLLLALFLVSAQGFSTEYFASPTGSGTTCSFGSPCTGHYLMAVKAGRAPGDILTFLPGDYIEAHTGFGAFVLTGASGTPANPIIVRCQTPGTCTLEMDVAGSTSGVTEFGDHVSPNADNANYIIFRDFIVNAHSNKIRGGERGIINMTLNSPDFTLTPGDPNNMTMTYGISPTGTVGATNGSTRLNWATGTTFYCGLATSTVSVTGGVNVTQTGGATFINNGVPIGVAGNTLYINDESYTLASVTDATHLVLNAGTPATNAAGQTLTPPGGCSISPTLSWNNHHIYINSVTYTIQTVLTNHRLTLSSTFGETTGTLPAIEPGNWTDDVITIGGDLNGVGGTDYLIKYVTDATHASLTTNYTGSPGAIPVHFPSTGDPTPLGVANVQMGGIGSKMINNWIANTEEGTLMSAALSCIPVGSPPVPSSDCGHREIYGNWYWANGFHGTGRGYGHALYLENPLCTVAGAGKNTCVQTTEAARSVIENNYMARSFHLLAQYYTTGTHIAYITMKGNTVVSPGHSSTLLGNDWPTLSSGSGIYIGAAGGATTCYPLASTEVGWEDITDGNQLYAAGITVGGSKGTCNTKIINNYVDPGHGGIGLGQNGVIACNAGPNYQAQGTTGNFTVTGNILNAPTNNTSCCGAAPGAVGCTSLPLLPTSNYPGNTFNNAPPASGKVTFYKRNKYELGRGSYEVFNYDGSATVQMDLCQAGGYVGEVYQVFNSEGPIPGVNTPLATDLTAGAITSCPKNITLSTTLATGEIAAVSGVQFDGVTPMPKPPDLGPWYVRYELYPRWGVATTPTPTLTPSVTPTNTPSFTQTPTFTPSLTPSITPTNTRTFTPSLTPTGTITPSLTPTRTPTTTPSLTATTAPTATPTPSGGGNNFNFPAIQCSLTPPMAATTGITEYPGSYISTSVLNSGLATCPFTIPAGKGGVYAIWGKVLGPDGNSDSFFVDMNGDGGPLCVTDADTTCRRVFDIASTKQPCDPTDPNACSLSKNWAVPFYNPFNDRNAPPTCGNCAGEGAQRLFTLVEGTNTLKIRGRDIGARLYYIYMTTDLGFQPSDPAPTPTPVVIPPGPVCLKRMKVCNDWKDIWVPCSVNWIECPPGF